MPRCLRHYLRDCASEQVAGIKVTIEHAIIYTCTPRSFRADEWFFMRDTGMLSRVLRGMGAESKVVMPLPAHAGDTTSGEVIRTAPANLRSAKWWKSLGIDGVILYSWGDIRYNSVARAIRAAGIRLVIHLDTDGVLPAWIEPDFPRPAAWYKLLRNIVYDLLRPRHLRCAHVITCSPELRQHLRHRLFYGAEIADRCRDLPTPVHPRFRYDNTPKQERVVCIGQWDEYAKRQEFMMETVGLFLTGNPNAVIDICGRLTPELATWHQNLPAAQQGRVNLMGFIDNKELPALYNRAMVSLCASRSEGTSIASAEALCCGCSLVAAGRPEKLRIVHGYIRRGAGHIAEQDTPEALAEALSLELIEWTRGTRHPQDSAEQWQRLFHADKALTRLFRELP